MKNKKLFITPKAIYRAKPVIIALGGSIIVPTPGKINTNFLKKFRKFILKFVKEGFKFIIVVGGGKISRTYQAAASKIVKLPYEDQDWLGIHATRINAHLLRTIFRKEAYPVVLDNPQKPLKTNRPIVIASGWRPGWSTDYIAVLLAKRFRAKEIIDAGDIPFVFTRDIKRYKNAKKILKISWSDYQKLVGETWIPGLPAPIDPIAAKEAKKLNIKAMVVKGTDLRNLRNVLKGLQPTHRPPAQGRHLKFRGTVISN